MQFGAQNPHQIVGKPIFDLVHPDYKDAVAQRIGKTLDGMYAPSSEEKFIKLDGTVFDVEVTAIPTIFGGKPAVQIVVHDITRRKQTEKQLTLLNFSLDHVNESVFLSDEQGCFIYVNLEACRTLGYTRTELLKMEVKDVVHSYSLLNWQSHINDLKKHKSLTFETRHTTKQGYVFPVEINVCLFEYNKIPYRLALTRDITERKLVEAEIKFKNEELLKLNAQKDKFFSIIAHDLRSPFSGFLGLTEMMVEKISTLPRGKIQYLAENMKDSATNLFRLLENLLDWAQQQQGLVSYNPELLSLHLVVKECMAMVLASAKNKEIEIVYDLPENIQVLADSNMLQTIIRNLVSNAVKYTPKGGKIYLLAKASDDKNIEISIKDTGIGMDSKMVNNLFKLDVRTSRPGTEGEPSTGLGLLLCNEFIEKHGGKIWVESQEQDLPAGKTGGTTFYFTLQS